MSGVATRHNAWKQRQPSASSSRAAGEALEKLAGDLDGFRQALADMALGVRVVLVYNQVQRKHIEPTEEQVAALREDPDLLPALIETGQARVYLRPPDVSALKLAMGYVMGGTPTATEAGLREQVMQAHRDHALLAQILRDHVPAEYLAPVSAELRRLAGGGDH